MSIAAVTNQSLQNRTGLTKSFFSEMSLGEFSEQLFILCIKLYRVTKNTPTQNSLFHIRKKVRTGERVCVCVCVCESVRVSVPTWYLVEREREREREGR